MGTAVRTGMEVTTLTPETMDKAFHPAILLFATTSPSLVVRLMPSLKGKSVREITERRNFSCIHTYVISFLLIRNTFKIPAVTTAKNGTP